MPSRSEMLLNFVRPPRVLYFYCDFITNRKYKFIVLVSKDGRDAFLFLINSKSYRFSEKHEVRITPSDFPFLHHDSFIDCNQLFQLPLAELSALIGENPENFDKGIVPDEITARIIQIVEESDVLSEVEKMKILPSLRQSLIR